MRRQPKVSDLCSRRRVDRRDGARPVSDENVLGVRIDADIICIIAQVDATRFGIVCTTIQSN